MTMIVIPAPRLRDAASDPFGESEPRGDTLSRHVLGGLFHFRSASVALLGLVESAYGGLPPHRFPDLADAQAEFHVELRLGPARTSRTEPSPMHVQSGAGLLCGVMDAANYVVLAPDSHRALVVASEDMLADPYHLRYELIEFAVFTLATRALGLVPLHGACVGVQGRGLLLLGPSGAGKSTLALHSLLRGLDFLAEDAVFVRPGDLLATGVANYLHMRLDALHLVDDLEVRRWIGQSPVIRRRSGVEKFEADLRAAGRPIARAPLALAGAVFVSPGRADDPDALLTSLPRARIAEALVTDQPYAAGQPGWAHFVEQLSGAGVYRLRRGEHPQSSVDALLTLLS